MKKFLHILLLSSVALLFNGCISGWGWLVPYNLQPSYHEFKKMCKLNELPNNEEKYNKILSYFDLSLDTLDWEKLNEKIWKIPEDSGDYKKGVFEYATQTELQQLSSRINGRVYFYSDKSEISQHNTNVMILHILYYTRRYFLDGNEGSGFYWSEERLGCDNADNMTPKGANNEQSRTD